MGACLHHQLSKVQAHLSSHGAAGLYHQLLEEWTQGGDHHSLHQSWLIISCDCKLRSPAFHWITEWATPLLKNTLPVPLRTSNWILIKMEMEAKTSLKYLQDMKTSLSPATPLPPRRIINRGVPLLATRRFLRLDYTSLYKSRPNDWWLGLASYPTALILTWFDCDLES